MTIIRVVRELMGIAILSGLFLSFQHSYLLEQVSEPRLRSCLEILMVAFNSGFLFFVVVGCLTAVVHNICFRLMSQDALDRNTIFINDLFILLSCFIWGLNMIGGLFIPWGRSQNVILFHMLFHDLFQTMVLAQYGDAYTHPFLDLWYERYPVEKRRLHHIVFGVSALAMTCFHLGLLLLSK